MSQTNFVTVTVTVSGSAVPTLNSKQIHEIEQSKETGQIVALVVLGIFVLLALILLGCWAVVCCRRPRKQPAIMTENPDSVRKGRGAFLPIIGRGRRKSNPDAGLEAARGGASRSAATSKQSLVGRGAPPGRRLSMWAEENQSATPSMPSPPTRAAHSRASSSASVERISRYDHQHSTSNLSSNSSHSNPPLQPYGSVSPYHDDASQLDFATPSNSRTSPPIVPPKIGRVDRGTPRVEPAGYRHEERRVSPVVSPIEDMRLGISRYPRYDGGMRRVYESGMYA